MSSEQASETKTTPTIRLYISPLNPTLLQSILPGSPKHTAADTASFHSIEAFPEKSYGYVEVPAGEAEKLKKKLNGSILRGMKVRVEDARPDKKRKSRDLEEPVSVMAAETGIGERHKRAKRQQPQDGLLPAVELPADRQVKRGWVQPAGSEKDKKQKKTKDSDGMKEVDKSQMIFRTTLPPNVSTKHSQMTERSKKKKERKGKEARDRVEIKEFTKTTKYPTFLRDTPISGTKSTPVTYIDNKGWVDEIGNIVEAVKGRKSMTTAVLDPVLDPATILEEGDQEVSERGAEQSSDSDPASADEEENTLSRTVTAPSSVTSSPEEILASNETPTIKVVSPIAEPTAGDERTEIINNTSSLPGAAPSKDIHPLEALFKRPASASQLKNGTSSTANSPQTVRQTPKPAPIVTSFSFFDTEGQETGAEDHDENTNVMLKPPQTPFTRRDLEMRSQRSAAPTPDTAAIGKRVRAPWLEGSTSKADDADDDDDDDLLDQTPDDAGADEHDFGVESTASPALGEASASASAPEQSEFEKHFWAHRGDYNRAWKARKREARKEARQVENRRIGRAR